jgi:hypothetical protein
MKPEEEEEVEPHRYLAIQADSAVISNILYDSMSVESRYCTAQYLDSEYAGYRIEP